MGSCCTSNSEVDQKENNPIQPNLLGPQVFIKSNFRLFDYTRTIGEPADIDELEIRIGEYVPSDIRCMRDSGDSLAKHSYVVIATTSPHTGKDVGIMLKFNEKGFKLMIAEMELLPSSQFVHIEKLHFPEVGSRKNGGLREIVRWAYEHKDELYVDPYQTPELNMGTRVFDYVKSLIRWSFIVGLALYIVP